MGIPIRFILVTLAVWLLYAFLFYKLNKARFSVAKALLPLLIFSVIVTVDLGVNFTAALCPQFNDGIGMHGVLSFLILGDDGWSAGRFHAAYQVSFFVSCFLTAAYMAAQIFEKRRKAK